ncbi:unnamed protein product, partial [Owenia fusiformis]
MESEVKKLEEKVGHLKNNNTGQLANTANKANTCEQRGGVITNLPENIAPISGPVNQLVLPDLRPRNQQTIIDNPMSFKHQANTVTRTRNISEVTKTLIGTTDSQSASVSTQARSSELKSTADADKIQDGGIAQSTSDVPSQAPAVQTRDVDIKLLCQDKTDHNDSSLPDVDWVEVMPKRKKRHNTAPIPSMMVKETKPLTFANVVKSSKPTPKPIPSPVNKKVLKSAMKPARLLRGITAVKHVTLYVENIAKDGCETDNDIVLQLKDHALTQGININKCWVVSNKYSNTRVGCKITVPVFSVVKALDSNSWPDPICCRRW